MFLSSFDISGYGLSAQRQRVNLISSNIANANTTRTDEGGPYRRRELILKAFNFDKVLNQKYENSNNLLKYEDPLDEMDSFDEQREPKPTLMSVYVAYPNINPVVEMADLIEATKAYQANVAAFQSAKNMATTAISMFQA